jgi:hypothetical protein
MKYTLALETKLRQVYTVHHALASEYIDTVNI